MRDFHGNSRYAGIAMRSAGLGMFLILGHVHAGSNVHTVSVLDNDNPPNVSFSSSGQSIDEGNGGGSTAVTVTVGLSAQSGLTVTVPYTVGGTATNPADHNAAAGTLTFPAGQASTAISFSVVADGTHEVSETVVFTLGTPTNATKVSPSTHTVTLRNDEPPGNDNVPNQFTFVDREGVARSTTIISNMITLSGTDSPAAVGVSGGQYSQNGGPYTSAAGTAQPGDTFRVSHTSASTYMTARNTTLTIGGVSDTFTSVTGEYNPPCDPICEQEP